MKSLPNNIEAEESVIGACLFDPGVVNLVTNLLKPEFFYKESLIYIFKAIITIHNRREIPDLITVPKELTAMGKLDFCGGVYGVTKLTNSVIFSDNLEHHCRIIHQCFLLREVYRISVLTHSRVNEPINDAFELIESTIKQFSDLTEGIESGRTLTLGQFVDKALEQAQESLSGKRKSIPVKLELLQKLCGGYKAQRLIILAARPGMGKTAVAFGDAIYAAEMGYPVAIFSQEMSGAELAERALSRGSGIDAMKISNNFLNQDEFDYLKGVKEFHKLPIYIDDTPGLTIVKIRNRAMKMKRDFNIQFMIVDYLQLCEGEGLKENREQEISKVSRGLKKLAKELDIPILALSQLNRKNEERAENKPKLSDLRESGAIEQDADMVILLHRPDYYGQSEYILEKETLPAQELMIMIIAKNRGGVIGEIPSKWKGSTMEIKDYLQF